MPRAEALEHGGTEPQESLALDGAVGVGGLHLGDVLVAVALVLHAGDGDKLLHRAGADHDQDRQDHRENAEDDLFDAPAVDLLFERLPGERAALLGCGHRLAGQDAGQRGLNGGGHRLIALLGGMDLIVAVAALLQSSEISPSFQKSITEISHFPAISFSAETIAAYFSSA